MKNLILISITVFLASSCMKDKVAAESVAEEENCDCVPLPDPIGPVSTGGSTELDDTYYIFPVFNPNNDDEFLYQEPVGGGNRAIYIYNISTGLKSLVYEGPIFTKADWGINDWIVFTQSDKQVWKVKPNGDSLIQVTENSGSWFHPTWSFGGNFITVFRAFLNYETEYVGAFLNESGVLLDTFTYTPSLGSFNEFDQFVGSSFGDVTVVNDNGFTEKVYQHVNQDDYVNDAVWISNSKLIIGKSDGIYHFNIQTGEQNKIFCHCDSREYRYPSVNRSRTKVLFTRFIREGNTASVSFSDAEIVIMDVDGSDMEVIEIP